MFERGTQIHKLLSLGLLMLVVWSGFIWLIRPALEASDEAREKYQENLSRLERYRRLAAELPAIRARNEVLAEDKSDGSALLASESASLAVAELQQIISKTVQQAGARLISMQSLKQEAEAGIQPITLKINLRLDNASLIKVLYDLETGSPRGVIDKLQIQRRNRRARRRQQDIQPQQLDVRFEYTAYRIG